MEGLSGSQMSITRGHRWLLGQAPSSANEMVLGGSPSPGSYSLPVLLCLLSLQHSLTASAENSEKRKDVLSLSLGERGRVMEKQSPGH